MLRRHLKTPGGVVCNKFIKELPAASLRQKAVLVQKEVVSYAAPYVGVPNALYALYSPVKCQKRAVGVVEVRASGREETGFPLALCAKVALEALHCIHICSRA